MGKPTSAAAASFTRGVCAGRVHANLEHLDFCIHEASADFLRHVQRDKGNVSGAFTFDEAQRLVEEHLKRAAALLDLHRKRLHAYQLMKGILTEKDHIERKKKETEETKEDCAVLDQQIADDRTSIGALVAVLDANPIPGWRQMAEARRGPPSANELFKIPRVPRAGKEPATFSASSRE